MMTDESIIDKMITQFLLNTTRQHRQHNRPVMQAAVHCGIAAAAHPSMGKVGNSIPLTTGSVAEFYIKPMLTHVGDIDVMFHYNTLLAIPRGHSPPTQLPDEFHHSVEVCEIIDSDFAGYVYLKSRYSLLRSKDDTYSAEKIIEGKEQWINNEATGENALIHGPALQYTLPLEAGLPIDSVPCKRCLSWPPQAAEWPTRHRNYDWPDSATVDRVVNNGCDLVGVAHRLCRGDEWKSKHQFRLSFSRAEIVLLNSWTPIQ